MQQPYLAITNRHDGTAAWRSAPPPSGSRRTSPAGMGRISEPIQAALPQQLAEDLVADFQSLGLAEDAPVDFGVGSGPCRGSEVTGRAHQGASLQRRRRTVPPSPCPPQDTF